MGVLGTNFDKMSQKVMENYTPEQKTYYEPKFGLMPNLNPNVLVSIIRNRKNYTLEELGKYIEDGLNVLLTYSNYSLGLLNSETVLKLVNQAISNISFVNNRKIEDVVPSFNKMEWCHIVYDYITSNDIRESILDLMIEITAKMFNRSVNKFMSFGFSKKFSAVLVISRYSDINEINNISRLNFAMMTTTEYDKIKSQQVVIYIYEELFDSASTLFSTTFFDYYDPEPFTQVAMDIYGYQSLAILEILNNMTTSQIEAILKMVSKQYTAGGYKYRFSLLALSQDYSRVRDMAEYLNYSGYIIPR